MVIRPAGGERERKDSVSNVCTRPQVAIIQGNCFFLCKIWACHNRPCSVHGLSACAKQRIFADACCWHGTPVPFFVFSKKIWITTAHTAFNWPPPGSWSWPHVGPILIALAVHSQPASLCCGTTCHRFSFWPTLVSNLLKTNRLAYALQHPGSRR